MLLVMRIMTGSKRLILAAAGLAAILVFVFVSTALGQPSPYAIVGDAFRRATGHEAEVVARAGGVPITRTEYLRALALRDLNNTLSADKRPTDPASVLRDALRLKLVAREAERRGLSPTPAEVDVYIAQVRSSVPSNEARTQLDAYLAGLGLTEDQFFSSDATRQDYARQLAVSRLAQQIVGTATGLNAVRQWDAFQDALVRSVTVEVLDPGLR